ncbi:sulfatase-like hydrolase/transferase [Helicobacter sp. 23-1045]
MAFFRDIFFVKHFALIFVLNSVFIALAQFSNLPKLFDAHWWHCLAFREAMLFCTYFLAFCVVFYLPLEQILGRFGRKIKMAFVALISISSIILLIVNLFLVLNFGGTLNSHLVGVALQSDPSEVSEFFGEYISAKFVIFSALIFALLGVTYRYGDKVVYKILIGGGQNKDKLDSCESNSLESTQKTRKSSESKNRIKIFWIIFATLLIALILVHCLRLRPYNERESDVVYVATTSIKDALDSIFGAMREYEQINADFEKYAKNIAHTPAPQDKKIANIVLIIGESAQRDKMQIYGHYLPNTPIFSAIHAQKSQNLFVFDNVISSQVTTFESLSQVLTFANQDNLGKKWFEYLNVVDAMRLGGYKTAVISNQERFSLWSKATTTIFSRADKMLWSADSVAGKRLDSMGFDEKILPILDNSSLGMQFRTCENFGDFADSKSSLNPQNFHKYKSHTTNTSIKILQNAESNNKSDSCGSIVDEKSGLRSCEQGNKTDSLLTKRTTSLPDLSPQDNALCGLFLTIHLMGSHVGYANRYPKDFERFTPRDIKDNPHIDNLSNAQKSRAKADLAQYANSILYTDFVVGEIIKRFANSDSIVIYISDHASDVWDTGIGSLRVDSKITRFMVEVPFVVFVSDEFIARHPALYTQIAQSTQKPFMIDDLIHALIDIAGFQIDGYESSRSIFSDDFNANRARMLGTKANQNYENLR